MVKALRAGGKLIFFGNGGSAADARHLAAELTGHFARERAALAAVALSIDTSALTAIGNDYGSEQVFERQIRALGRRGDLCIAISTSSRLAVLAVAIVARHGYRRTLIVVCLPSSRQLPLAGALRRVPNAAEAIAG